MEHTQLDILWIIVASALVLVMRVGFAMLESGMVRSKNAINVSMKVLTDLGVSLLAFWAVGFGIMFGTSHFGLFGGSYYLMSFNLVWPSLFFLFHAMFASTGATIVSGAVAERIKFSSYMFITFLFSALIYPVLGHWVWGGSLEGVATGWLAKLGFIDFAGCTVVHSTGGWISLATIIILGARLGRYNADGSVNRITGAGLQISIFGTILLWFGWFGFNGGSTLALNNDVPAIIIKTSLAGAAGMIVTLAVGWSTRKFPDVSLVINGALAGLVGATASCAYINESSAVLIGAIAGLIMLFVEWLLDKLRIDDAVTAIPVHLGAGIWGTLAVGIFGDPAKLGTGLNHGQQIAVQALGVVSCGAWAFGVAFGLIWILNKFFPIRVSAFEEAQGLNVVEHKASTEIYDLYKTLEDQARTGDLSLRAPIEPFTEVGQIATIYNSVMDKLQDGTVEKGEYLNILENVSDGLFLLDREGKIGPYYSAALEKLFGSKSLSGQSLDGVLSNFLSDQSRSSLSEFLEVCFDSQFQWRHVERLNPLVDVEAFGEESTDALLTRHLQFNFQRIEEAGKIERLLVLVRDITAEKQLSEEVSRTREQGQKEMELLYRVLHVEPATLALFLDGVRQDLNEINECFRNDKGDVHERLTQIFQLTHAIKGNADLLELGFIGEKAEQLEEQVRAIMKQPEPQGEDFLSLTLLFSALNSASDELLVMLGKLQSFRGALPSSAPGTNRDFTAESLSAMTLRLANRYGKEVDWSAKGSSLAELPSVVGKQVRDIVVQMLRNAVYHGIELPELRTAAGKNPKGKVEMETTISSDSLRVLIRDDGAGVDTEALKEKALSAGILTAENALTFGEKELVPLMFHPGLSTAETVDTVAGKGIGMALVRTRLKELNGRMTIRTRKGLGSEFRFEFPLNRSA